jgi:hypothetical protein
MDKGIAMTGLKRHIQASLALTLLTGLAAGCSHYNYPYAHVEPEAIPAQVCSGDADNDGDGVTNCNDMCPNSVRGDRIGPDGCPLPPPPMEPKPYRG